MTTVQKVALGLVALAGGFLVWRKVRGAAAAPAPGFVGTSSVVQLVGQEPTTRPKADVAVTGKGKPRPAATRRDHRT